MSQATPHHVPTITPQRVTIPPGHGGRQVPLFGLAAALIGLGASAALARGNAEQFFFSYLVAFLYFLSLALGGLFFVLVQFATRAGWSVVVRRLAEGVMGVLPLFIPLFVPIALGLHGLYHWSHTEAVAGDHLLQHKAPYLNSGFFLMRSTAYLLIWSALAVWFRRQSLRQDITGEHQLTRRLQTASGPAILLYGLSLTFAAFDWIMSLDPHWFSTIFGVYYFSGAAVGLFALLILLAVSLSRAGLLGGALTTEHLHDLGKLLLAFVAFWAYIAFSQYFLIWYANIPEETVWFLRRWESGWRELSVILGLGHFVIPFFFLLPRTIKRSPAALLLAAIWMLVVHYLDLYWLVMPALKGAAGRPGLLDLTTFIGIGGLFFATLGWLLQGRPLIPVRDPRLPESVSFENV